MQQPGILAYPEISPSKKKKKIKKERSEKIKILCFTTVNVYNLIYFCDIL